MAENNNKMKEIRIEKVTLNMGVGQSGDELKKAQQIMEKIANGEKSVQTLCKVKQPLWDIRPGMPIGCKVTLRGKKAIDFLKNALTAKGNVLNKKSFDVLGNFGFGIKEYIDLPGSRYDPKLGIRGFDVLVSLERRGYRVKRRKHSNPVGKNHLISKDDAVEFAKNSLGVEIQ